MSGYPIKKYKYLSQNINKRAIRKLTYVALVFAQWYTMFFFCVISSLSFCRLHISAKKSHFHAKPTTKEKKKNETAYPGSYFIRNVTRGAYIDRKTVKKPLRALFLEHPCTQEYTD